MNNRYALMANPEKIDGKVEIKIVRTEPAESRAEYQRRLNSGWCLLGWVESELCPGEIRKGICAQETQRIEQLEQKLALLQAMLL